MADNQKIDSVLATVSKYNMALVDGDADTLHSLRTDDFTLEFVHGDAFEDAPMSLEETRQFWPAWVAAFSEMDYEVTRTIAAPEVVVVQWVFTGIHTGEIGEPVFNPPAPPSGRAFRLRGISVYDFAGASIHKETIYIDQATLMLELDAAYE
jgi:predicted ester cyclase